MRTVAVNFTNGHTFVLRYDNSFDATAQVLEWRLQNLIDDQTETELMTRVAWGIQTTLLGAKAPWAAPTDEPAGSYP